LGLTTPVNETFLTVALAGAATTSSTAPQSRTAASSLVMYHRP